MVMLKNLAELELHFCFHVNMSVPLTTYKFPAEKHVAHAHTQIQCTNTTQHQLSKYTKEVTK